MGTNYYFKGNDCPCCESARGIHLGKLSGGWRFLLRKQPFYANWEEMKAYLKKVEPVTKIVDEYGEVISVEEFIKLVEWKQCEKHPLPQENDYPNQTINGYRFSESDFS